MNSFLFLGALFTLCQCGGTPAPAPTQPPREGPKCHNVWIDGACDLAYAQRGWYDAYLPSPDGTFSLEKATNEAECTQACQDRARAYGYGCCQWGDFWGKDSSTKCRFATSQGFAKTPTPSMFPMTGMNRISHCSECESDSYRMSYPHNCNGKRTKQSVSGFREDVKAVAFTDAYNGAVSYIDELCYVFAAIGLSFVLYGAYKHYSRKF